MPVITNFNPTVLQSDPAYCAVSCISYCGKDIVCSTLYLCHYLTDVIHA